MKYILVAILGCYGGMNSTILEFNSKEACEAALVKLMEVDDKAAKSFCIPKGK